MSLNDRLKSRRKELGLTQKMLADMVGVSHVSISQWESGATSPSGINLVELVHALKTTTDWVVSGETVFRPLSISSEPDQKLQHALAKVADEMATIPTEIFNIASKFGILMTYDQLPDHESGNIKKQDEYYLITLNSRHSEAFKRFTSACLIGHVILHKESINKGLSVNLRDLLEQIQERDARDRGRAVAPLKPAADALIIDSTQMTIEEVLETIMTEVSKGYL